MLNAASAIKQGRDQGNAPKNRGSNKKQGEKDEIGEPAEESRDGAAMALERVDREARRLWEPTQRPSLEGSAQHPPEQWTLVSLYLAEFKSDSRSAPTR